MKNSKVKVKICLGTACFVQGGADLLLYNDFVDPAILAECEIEGCPCLGECKVGNGNAPFVSINDKIYSGVNPESFCRLRAEAVKNA